MKHRIYFILAFTGCLLVNASDIFAQCDLPGTPPCASPTKKPAARSDPGKNTKTTTIKKVPSRAATPVTRNKVKPDRQQPEEETYYNETIQYVKNPGNTADTQITRRVATATGVLTSKDNALMVAAFVKVLKVNNELSGFVLLGGTDRETSRQEAEIRKLVKLQGYNASKLEFVRAGLDPGLKTHFYIVPTNGEIPTEIEFADDSVEEFTPANVGRLNSRATNLATPQYPEEAKQVRAAGRVLVQVTVDGQGNVTAAKAYDGHPLLRGAAENAARQSKFAPQIVEGKSFTVTGTIFYNFVAQ